MNFSDNFGFLNVNESYLFEGGAVDILDDFEQSRDWVSENTHKDGYYYPPQIRSVKLDSNTSEVMCDIPNTQRPALIHRLPASHSIELSNLSNADDARGSDAGFIVHLLGYIFGTRLQFHDWWHDGRVTIKSSHNINITKVVIEDFISKSFKKWNSWTCEIRKWFLNVLIMHSRAPTYEWDWERLMIEYMVFDGIYKITSDLYQISANGHRQRFETLFSQFGLKLDNDKIDEIHHLRNNLFHQGLWDMVNHVLVLRIVMHTIAS